MNISREFKYISSLTFVTGLNLPLRANMFFLYSAAAGNKLFPSGPNKTASVIPFLTNSRLRILLSTSLNIGPDRFTVSISI